jgi:alcohol dehydrogenase (NADP+)
VKSLATAKIEEVEAMLEIPAYGAAFAKAPLAPLSIEWRKPDPHDVLIDILYCGVCHSDIHQVRGDWGAAVFPMVPGHEIIGIVAETGDQVNNWKIGDAVGVGGFVDSCRRCQACEAGDEQFCGRGMSQTYNSYERHGKIPSYGGYSTCIIVDENYVLRIPESISLERAAPLLCAGITTYSSLRQFGVKAGDKVAVVGLGGPGHIAVKFAKAMGAKVTVLSHSSGKREDALRLGADDFVNIRYQEAFEKNAGRFDFIWARRWDSLSLREILDTVSEPHDYNAYLNLLRRDGMMVLVGLPHRLSNNAARLITQRRSMADSLIHRIRETQEMLDFCAEYGVAADVEVIPIQQINEAYERMVRGDVRYRFVIEMVSLKEPSAMPAWPTSATAFPQIDQTSLQ